MCLSSAHCVDRKNGCPLTSLAPALDPSRRFSSLTNSLRIRDLQLLFSSANRRWKLGYGLTSISLEPPHAPEN